MTKIKQKAGAGRRKKQLQHHKRSVLIVISALVLLIVVIAVDSVSLQAKNKDYQKQEAELEKQLAEENQRTEDIEEFEQYEIGRAHV